MTSPRQLLAYLATAVGFVGIIACLAAMLVVWRLSLQLRHTTEAVFGGVDNLLAVVQKRTELAADRVKESAITTEDIAAGLKEWTAREAEQRVALRLNLAEKTQNLGAAMQQADDWLEVSASATRLVQQVVGMAGASGLQIDAARIDWLVEEIDSVHAQLGEATDAVERLHQRTAALGEDPSFEERVEQAGALALRVIATLSSLDTRLEKFAGEISQTQEHLLELEGRMLWWIRMATIAAALVALWMAAGQAALCCLASRSVAKREA